MPRRIRSLALASLVLACAARPTGVDEHADTTTETGDPTPDCEPILQQDGTPSGYEQCSCVYGCRTDADCGSAPVCLCAPLDADCPDGLCRWIDDRWQCSG